jgi:PIN domain nuclease of toxin-antitoxin system
MTPLLLDTRTLLWAVDNTAALSPTARTLLEDLENEPLVSIASLWEIAIKSSLGKLNAPDELPDEIEATGFGWLAVAREHVWAVRSLPHHHRDPFDRLLVAQALTERLPLISNDAQLDAYGIKRVW